MNNTQQKLCKRAGTHHGKSLQILDALGHGDEIGPILKRQQEVSVRLCGICVRAYDLRSNLEGRKRLELIKNVLKVIYFCGGVILEHDQAITDNFFEEGHF